VFNNAWAWYIVRCGWLPWAVLRVKVHVGAPRRKAPKMEQLRWFWSLMARSF